MFVIQWKRLLDKDKRTSAIERETKKSAKKNKCQNIYPVGVLSVNKKIKEICKWLRQNLGFITKVKLFQSCTAFCTETMLAAFLIYNHFRQKKYFLCIVQAYIPFVMLPKDQKTELNEIKKEKSLKSDLRKSHFIQF